MPRPLLASLLMLPLVLAPAAALAAPATEAEMNLYSSIAAVNVCLSRAAGVPFDKAVGIAGETIALLIQDRHKGLISQVGPKALTIEELLSGSARYAVLGAAQICPKEVPADVLAKVQEALKPSPEPQPAAKPQAKPAAEVAPVKTTAPVTQPAPATQPGPETKSAPETNKTPETNKPPETKPPGQS